MGNREKVARECDRANELRDVFRADTNDREFFREIRGSLLVSGCGAGQKELMLDLVNEYVERNDMPTILLSGRPQFLRELQEAYGQGGDGRVIISSPESRNYQPLFGMSDAQITDLIRVAAEECGFGNEKEKVLQYAKTLIQAVASKYTVSLPAVRALLKESDDYIAAFAVQMGLTKTDAERILGDQQAGLMLRQITDLMATAFEQTAVPESETKYNLLSGSLAGVPLMAFCQNSKKQRILNACLHEELSAASDRVPKLRVILDEVSFVDESDVLLLKLFELKRQGRVELVAVSENVKEMLPNASLNFGNVCLFLHANSQATESLSKELFGEYTHYFPVGCWGKPAAMIFTLENHEDWKHETEIRPRVGADDLCGKQRLFFREPEKLAVRIQEKRTVYLVPKNRFVPCTSVQLCDKGAVGF